MIVKDFRRKPKNIKKSDSSITTELVCEQLSNIYFPPYKEKFFNMKMTGSDAYNSDFLYPLLTEIAHQHGILSHEHFFSKLLSKKKSI